MLLHAQQVMPPYGYICNVSMVQTLTVYGNSPYLLDDPRIVVTTLFIDLSDAQGQLTP